MSRSILAFDTINNFQISPLLWCFEQNWRTEIKEHCLYKNYWNSNSKYIQFWHYIDMYIILKCETSILSRLKGNKRPDIWYVFLFVIRSIIQPIWISLEPSPHVMTNLLHWNVSLQNDLDWFLCIPWIISPLNTKYG